MMNKWQHMTNAWSSLSHQRKLASKHLFSFLLLTRRPHWSRHSCCWGTSSKGFNPPFFNKSMWKRVSGIINPKWRGQPISIHSLLCLKSRGGEAGSASPEFWSITLLCHCGTRGIPCCLGLKFSYLNRDTASHCPFHKSVMRFQWNNAWKPVIQR